MARLLLKRLALWPCVLLAVLLTGGCAGRLFYHPDHHTYRLPSEEGLAYEDVFFEAPDATRLHGWFIRAVGEAKGTVIHFHGNAQNMTAHYLYVNWLPAKGFNVLTFDYRGYGQSEGRPTRRGLQQDGLAAIEYVRSRQDLDPDRLLVLGQSMGGAVALSVLGREAPKGVRAVAIDSSFYSYKSIVRDKIGLMPGIRHLRWPLSWVVVGNSYSPGPVVEDIAPVPLLLVHGKEDHIVSYHHGEALYHRAREPKTFWSVEQGRHTQAFGPLRGEYADALVAFFEAASASD